MNGGKMFYIKDGFFFFKLNITHFLTKINIFGNSFHSTHFLLSKVVGRSDNKLEQITLLFPFSQGVDTN